MLKKPLTTVSPIHLAILVVSGFTVFLNLRPVDDLDAFWHVELGRQILHQGTLDPQGTWLAVPPPRSWSTTQWAAEALMALLVDAGGWVALVAGRAVALAATLLALALALARHRRPALALGCLVVVGPALVQQAQDRPQTFTLPLLVWLGWACTRWWTQDRPPRPLTVAAACLVWAQLHGLWILAPGCFALVTAAIAVDRRLDRAAPATAARRAAGTTHHLRVGALVTVAALAGLANPRGAGSFTAPLGFAGAGQWLSEWHPSALDTTQTVACALLVVACGVSWLAAPRSVPLAEPAWVLAWAVFAALAYRNAVPAMLALAPAAAAAVHRALLERRGPPRAATGPAEARALLAAGAVLTAVLAVLLGGRLAGLDPLAKAPVAPLARQLAAQPQPVRVFNAYNAAGQLIAFGGGKARLVVDGRFDLWGPDHVARLVAAQQIEPGWQDTVDQLAPQAYVLPARAPLATLLQREGGWQAHRSGTWVLLLADTTPGGRPR